MAEKIRTPKFRVSFPDVFTPKAFKDKEPTYGLSMIFEAGTDLSNLKAIAQAEALRFFGKEKLDKLIKTKKLKSPFHSGVEKDFDGYDDDCVFMSARTKRKPEIVDLDGKTYLYNDEQFYGGCYAHATLTVYGYDKDGGTGVAFGLVNLQKLGDGERFGAAASSARDDFDAVEGYEDAAADDDDGAAAFFGGDETPAF